MKEILLIPLLCIALLSQAQEGPLQPTGDSSTRSFSKGTWLAGLQAGRGGSVFIGHNLTTHAYGGYFLTNLLLIGLQATRIQEGIPSAKDVSYLLGPFVRVQLTRTRFSPFLFASGQIGQHNITSFVFLPSGEIVGLGPSGREYSRLFGAGLSIRLVAALRVDLGVAWQDRVNRLDSPLRDVDGLYQVQLGLNYEFGHLR